MAKKKGKVIQFKKKKPVVRADPSRFFTTREAFHKHLDARVGEAVSGMIENIWPPGFDHMLGTVFGRDRKTCLRQFDIAIDLIKERRRKFLARTKRKPGGQRKWGEDAKIHLALEFEMLRKEYSYNECIKILSEKYQVGQKKMQTYVSSARKLLPHELKKNI
jgi:hypothetical protein